MYIGNSIPKGIVGLISGSQTMYVSEAVRLLLQRQDEAGQSLIVLSADVAAAFDHIRPPDVARA